MRGRSGSGRARAACAADRGGVFERGVRVATRRVVAYGDRGMIRVTRLNQHVVVINTELIKMIESTPDTLITLINGDTLMVRESVDEVVDKAMEWARQVRGFRVV